MGFCADPTPEMGEYSVETRRESFILRGEDTYDGPRRHAFHVTKHECGQGSVEILTEDIPKIRAALDQVEAHEGKTPALQAALEALRFYAEESRYDYDETCCPCGNNPGQKRSGQDVLSDNGEIARAAIAAITLNNG